MEEVGRLRGRAPVELLSAPGAGRRRARPGQVAGEFLVVVSAVLILFFMFFALYSGQLVNSAQAGDSIVAMRVASAVQSAIDYAYLAGDGAEYNVSIRTSGVNVTVSGGEVVASSRYGVHYQPLLTDNVNSTVIVAGPAIFRNRGGVIEIVQPA